MKGASSRVTVLSNSLYNSGGVRERNDSHLGKLSDGDEEYFHGD